MTPARADEPNAECAHSDLSPLLGAALIGLMRAHRAAVARELAPLGLHVGQEKLLDVIVGHEGLTQAELARTLCIEAPTVTKMLQRLDGSGVLERRADRSDKRQVRVWSTDRGRRLHREMLGRWAAVDERMTRDLTADELIVVRGLVARMAANLSPADYLEPIDQGAPR